MNLTKGLLEPLQPYKASVGNTAAVATIVQFLTGSLVCLNLVSNECAKNVDCVPLIGGILNGILALLSLFLNNDSEATVFICSIAALALYTIYTLIYILYTCNWKEELCLALAAGVGIAAVVLGYTHYQDPELVPWIFELIVAAIALTVLGSPLLYTKEMMEDEDASAIQMPVAASNAAVCLLWLICGMLDYNDFVAAQNAIGFLLAAIQVGLKIMYPGWD